MTGAEAPTTSGAAAAAAVAPASSADCSKPKMTFRGAARLVVAAKRFQAALNPTYTFGKRADSGGNASTTVSGWTKADATTSPVDVAAAKAAGGASIPPLSSPPLGATPPKKVYDHHGHKGNLIFNPLPEIFTAEKA